MLSPAEPRWLTTELLPKSNCMQIKVKTRKLGLAETDLWLQFPVTHLSRGQRSLNRAISEPDRRAELNTRNGAGVLSRLMPDGRVPVDAGHSQFT